MIQVYIYRAKKNVSLQKKGTFLEGALYFGRMSRNGNCFVVRSEEGNWIPVERYDWAKRGNRYNYFETQTWFLTNNRKNLNEIDNPNEFLKEMYKCQQCGVFRQHCIECL